MAFVQRFKKDRDGRLYVSRAPISKAMVAHYRANELPGAPHGNPNRSIAIYRPAWELQRAAPTFRNLPILSEHPTSGGQIDRSLIIGTTSGSALFKSPYLAMDMILWSPSAQDFATNGSAEQVSAGYNYNLLWQSGTFENRPFDAIQTNIIGHHVALVPYGRSGPDVSINRKVA